MNILSVYETSFIDGKEYLKILVQGIDTQERRERLTRHIKEANKKEIDKGNYLYEQNLYAHPNKAIKPYLDKYKIV